MAACEKICEVSGEYPGGIMWDYKRNSIQVMPACRKLFRGQQATLHIFEDGWKEVYSFGGYSDAQLECIKPQPTDDDWEYGGYLDVTYTQKKGLRHKEFFSVFFDNIKGYKDYLRKNTNRRLCMQYAYILEVPGVPGNVKGLYMNFSFDISTVKRKLTRMVGKNNIKIVHHKGDVWDKYYDLKEKY